MRESGETHIGKLCDVCGNVGYVKSLATCFQCSKAREHIYCMRTNLKSVPDVWFCEACRLPGSSYSKAVEIDPVKIGSPHKSVAHSLFRNSYLKTVETAKVKFISAKEAIRLTSGAKSKVGGFGPGAASDFMPPISKGTPAVSKTVPPKCFAQKGNINPTYKTSGHSKPLGSVQVSTTPRQRAIQTLHPLHGEISTPIFSCKPSVSERMAKMKAEEDRPGRSLASALKIEPSLCKVKPRKNVRFVDSELYRSPLKLSGGNEPNYGSNDKPYEGGKLGLNKEEGKEAAAAPNKDCFCKEELVDFVAPSEQIRTSNTRMKDAVYSAPCASSPSMESLSTRSSGNKIIPIVKPVCLVGGAFPNVARSKNSVQDKDLPVVLPKLENDHQNLPALDATWKGSFEILDVVSPGKIYDGFWAHPPGKVSRKAYEFSKKMPGVLQFKLQNRCDVWAEIFDTYSPTGNDIALYFFPQDFERSKQMYFHLGKFMEVNDLVMQSFIDGVELLIFTSKQLSMDSRLNMESYLWGVFHRVKDSKVNHAHGLFSSSVFPTGDLHGDQGHLLRCGNEDSPKVVDMEIDMVGGEDVGRIDIPVRTSIPQGSEVQFKLQVQPQGFTSSNAPNLYNNINKSCGRVDRSTLGVTGSSSCVVWPSHNVVSYYYPHRPNEVNTVPQPLLHIKRESNNHLDVPPGFARQVKSEDAYEGLLQKSLVKVPNVLDNLDARTPRPLLEVKGELDAPPGFSRKFTGEAGCEGSLQKSLGKVPDVIDSVSVSPVFSRPLKLKEGNGSFEVIVKKEKVLPVDEKVSSFLEDENGSYESNIRGTFQPLRKVTESLEVPLICDKVPVQGHTKDSMAAECILSEKQKRSDQPRSLLPAHQKACHQRHFKDGNFRLPPDKSLVWNDSEMKAIGREKDSLIEMDKENKGLFCTQRSEILPNGNLQSLGGGSKWPDPSGEITECRPVWDDSKRNTIKREAESLVDMKLEKKRSLSTLRPEILADGSLQSMGGSSKWPVPSKVNTECLQLFPMDVKTEAGEFGNGNLDVSLKLGARQLAKNKPPVDQDSFLLSLTMPQYMKDRER